MIFRINRWNNRVDELTLHKLWNTLHLKVKQDIYCLFIYFFMRNDYSELYIISVPIGTAIVLFCSLPLWLLREDGQAYIEKIF